MCTPDIVTFRSVEVIKLQLKKSLELKEPLQKVSHMIVFVKLVQHNIIILFSSEEVWEGLKLKFNAK
jgi:hypothetical protein